MILRKMVKEQTICVFIIIALAEFASSLYLSHSSVTTDPGKSLAISCKDKGGQPVMWKGPKGSLSANTKPKIQDTSIGKLLIFSPTRIQDTGNYTCSVVNNKNDHSVFSLIVEESNSKADSEEELGNDEESEPDFSPPIHHENRLPTSHRKTHKSHRPKHRQPVTSAEDTDTALNTESSTFDHPYTRSSHSGRSHKHASEDALQFKDTPEIQRGKEGDNATLRCEVNRPYKISWQLDEHEDEVGTKYIPIGDGLLIINVTRADNRIFVCEALKSSTGQVIDKKIHFVVEHKPVPITIPPDPETGEQPSLWEQDEVVYGFLGENVNLTCEVEAEPAPRFEWKSAKGQNKIGRYLNVGSHKSLLQLKMTKETPDKYQCTASNKYGKLKKFFDLQIGTRPVPPEWIELKTAGSDSLELVVNVPEPDEDTIANNMEPHWINIFYKVTDWQSEGSTEEWQQQEFNITLDTYTLTKLNSSTTYDIMAATRNVAGLSALSNITSFNTTAGVESSTVQSNTAATFSLAIIYINLLGILRLA
uniref:Hemicentin-1 isoform X2 n=1 Tax=Diabrotica virgifera virgifera TaxID=50390 RepID=A0A6P7EYT5_DIAVI